MHKKITYAIENGEKCGVHIEYIYEKGSLGTVAGYIIRTLVSFNEPKKIDLYRELINCYIQKETFLTYNSSEYVKDMGTPERLKMVISDHNSRKIKSRNLKNK